MSNDIVVRLREFHYRTGKFRAIGELDGLQKSFLNSCEGLSLEAIIEIERLRARLDELRAERAPAP